ncbi:MAG: transcription factor [Phylliscum demangeonii]|nr:MAG: transcription factor [Phylliscum demangeonii]
MPLSSTRRTRSRRDAGLDEPSDPALLDSSPSRPTRKRRKRSMCETVTAPAPAPPLPPPGPGEDDEPAPRPTDKGAAAAAADELINGTETTMNAVVACLNLASEDVKVAMEYDNSRLEKEFKHGVQAYAKIAGHNWTYYVKTLKTNIGRPPDPPPGTVPAAAVMTPQSSPPAVHDGGSSSSTHVHIDLGPSKLVSRQHATIEYGATGPDGRDSWQIVVHGRNGVKVNEQQLKRGATQPLQSGDVLEMGGTQMMFVTPNEGPHIHAIYLEKARGIQASQAETDLVPNARPRPARSSPRRPAPLASDGVPPSSAVAGLGLTGVDHSTPRLEPDADSEAKPNPSPAYGRGFMLESTEEIDYSQESAKDIKPPYSYATMIGQAILASEEEKLTLHDIYEWIMDKYAFYRRSQAGWQNSIRHNLSLNKAFEKIPRRTDEPGKGMKWQIVSAQREDFTRRTLRLSTRGGAHRTSSAPTSPATRPDAAAVEGGGLPSNGPAAPTTQLARRPRNDSHQAGAASRTLSASAGSVTPPRAAGAAYPVTAREAFTPDRGAHPSQLPRAHHNGGGGHAAGIYGDGSPAALDRSSVRAYPGLGATAHGSPNPALSSSAAVPGGYLDEDTTPGGSLVTPAPRRQEVRLAPPSTAQVPSTYMPASSPAAFWRYADYLESSPAKPLPDRSPVKRRRADSSSPPPVTESPSKAGRDPSGAMTTSRAGAAEPGASARGSSVPLPTHAAAGNDGDGAGVGLGVGLGADHHRASSLPPDPDSEMNDAMGDEMNQGIDLARGFQPIGSFTSQMTNATAS